MLVQGSLSSRFQTSLTATLLLALGAMAFSMPALDNTMPPTPAVAEPVNVATVSPPAMSVANEAALSVSTPTAVKRATVAKKVVTTVPAAAVVADERAIEQPAAVAVAEPAPVITLALAETSVRAAEPVLTSDAVAAKAETYRDWGAIQQLAKATADAREQGIQAVTEWNSQAEACGVPVRKFVRLELNMGKAACRTIMDAIKDASQIASFWNRCENFGSSYNRLSNNFVHAEESQFVDRRLVEKELMKSYQTLSEFCSTATYQQKYPAMITLITHAKFWMAGAGD